MGLLNLRMSQLREYVVVNKAKQNFDEMTLNWLRICGRTIDLIQTTTFMETNHWNIPPLDLKEADKTPAW